MLNQLQYKRQFVVAKKIIGALEAWQYRQVGDVHVYVHHDLKITARESQSTLVLLLGDLFDPANPGRTNDDIISNIISNISSLEDLIVIIKPYLGRYVLIYKDETKFVVLHDPLGLREIYYCTQPNQVICGSQPNLIAAFSEPELGITEDKELLHFYEHDMKSVRSRRLWVGDETYFTNIRHLMPNHYLDIPSLIAIRYWPNKRLENIELSMAVKLSCDYLKGALEAITLRYDAMMAVTAGTDSRSLLAASKDVRDRIYYFINKDMPLTDSSADIRIPKSVFEKLNIPFHVHDVDGPVDEEFKKTFLSNVFMSTDLILPTIYNVYFKHHQSKVNLLGVGEIGRDYYGKAPRDLTGYYLARSLKYKCSRYATAQCEKWLKEARIVSESYNVDIMKLFLWEGLLANWGVVGNSESDIAIEEIDPYDSHYIYEIMLSVDRAQGDFFEAIIKEMWPELWEFPINPPETMMDLIKKWLINLGVFNLLKRTIYTFDYWKYRKLV
ncbi:MAG: hypothetical protein ACXV8Q_17830 [Methylobacter sp.]